MEYTIEVTQHDINCGHRESCQKCPVAIAVKRSLKAENVFVTDIFISADVGFSHLVFYLPEHVFEKIREYDQGVGMVPFNFVLTEEDRA